MSYEGFVPLDRSIQADFELLSSKGMLDILDRARGGVGRVPHELHDLSSEWRSRLEVEHIGKYCAALASLFRELLVKSGRPRHLAAGMAYELQTDPRFEFFENQATPQGTVVERRAVCSAEEIGEHVGLHLGESPERAELGWRSIAACLPECSFPILPGLALRGFTSAVQISLT